MAGVALAMTALATVFLALAMRTLVRATFDPIWIVLAFSIGFIVLARSYVLLLGLDTPYPDYLFDEWWSLLAEVNLYTVVWIMAIIVGAGFMEPVGRRFAIIFPKIPRLETAELALPVAGLSVAALTIQIILLQHYGSFAEVTVAAKVKRELAGEYILLQFAGVAIIFKIALAVHLLARRTAHGALMGGFVILLFVPDLASYYAWGNREAVAAAILTLGITVHIFVRRFRVWEVVCGLILLLGLVVGLRLLRDIFTAGTAFTLKSGNLVRIVSESVHMVRLDAFMLVVRDWGHSEWLRWGEDQYNALIGIIPRMLWPDKPLNVLPGPWFRQIYEPDKVNGWPFTAVGEWYINFGIVGVVIGGLLTGLLLRGAQARYSGMRSNPLETVVVAFISLLVMQEGVSTSLLIRYITWIVPLVLTLWMLKHLRFALRFNAGQVGRGQHHGVRWDPQPVDPAMGGDGRRPRD